MLEVKHLKAGYDAIAVVHDVSLKIEEGKTIAIIGTNGAGKSTTLKAITGLIKPMGGEIHFDGKNISQTPAHKIVQLGISMVPEGRHLFGKLNVGDNLLMGAYLMNDPKKQAETLEKVYKIFPRIKERISQLAETLSGGEQQMVAIARGMMSNPKLMILDEPSLGLAPILVEEVFSFIREIKALGVTIILIEQNVNMAIKIADYVYVIKDGVTYMEGTPDELAENEEVKKAYLGM